MSVKVLICQLNILFVVSVLAVLLINADDGPSIKIFPGSKCGDPGSGKITKCDNSCIPVDKDATTAQSFCFIVSFFKLKCLIFTIFISVVFHDSNPISKS